MKLRTRLLLTWAAIVVLLVGSGLYALNQLTRLQGIAEELQGFDAQASAALGRLQVSVSDLDRALRSYVAVPSTELRDRIRATLASSQTHIDVLKRSGFENAVGETETRIDALEEASEDIISIVETGRTEAATTYLESVKESLTEAQLSIDGVAAAIDRRGQARVEHAQSISAATSTTALLALGAAFVVALVLGAWTTRAVTAPLTQVQQAMSRVADGEFVVPSDLPYERRDELGDLSRSFRTMTARLAELDRMKAEFISVASHELKTPLNVIGGYAELLDDGVYGPLEAKQHEALESIQDQTRTLTDLVNQLLDLSRIEAGGFRVEVMDVESEELFGAVRRMFEPLAKQKNIDFRVVIDDVFPRVLRADPDRLRNEVLGNLLSNAFKFTPDGGSIRLDAHPGVDGRVGIDVTDSGGGIPQEELQHIFDKFYQVGQEARVQGSGLGLAIAREIVEVHGGEISAESAPGRGTTFRILLPKEPPAQAAGRLPAPASNR
ncbi:MAG TPA: HAMP domain-containing sensor histidine kinase [Longimicrobiales bacterium]|nr:HAMP domain-containing sensor histidine kinase [Longimicrobiales bacterium]